MVVKLAMIPCARPSQAWVSGNMARMQQPEGIPLNGQLGRYSSSKSPSSLFFAPNQFSNTNTPPAPPSHTPYKTAPNDLRRRNSHP